jgi:transcriptional regulator with PAS, ATPase and Fis domain
VVIGAGEKIASVVEQKGMQYISVMGGENTIRDALGRAKTILDAQQREKRTAFEYMKEVTNYSNEGIIAINEKRIITVFNSIAARFFGIKETEVIGHSLADLSQFRDLIKLFESPYKKLGYIVQTSKGAISVNRVPHFDNQRLIDVFISFKEVTRDDAKSNRDVLARGFVAKYSFDDIIHESSKMERVVAKAKKYANTNSAVLIRGESGTGKELLAQSIHNGHLLRSERPFVAVNCASLEDTLLRSELFGYTEGSFTGAVKGGKPGLFELAQGGTLFLDEIGKMKIDLQGSLLRVLQEKEVRRIGSDRVIPVDVRIIAASNEDLEDLVRRGAFREDLYFRLNVLQLNLPALRGRKEDIPALAHFLSKKLANKFAKPNYLVPEPILDKMKDLEWQGNIRQLENFLERCTILAENESEWLDLVDELLEEELLINLSEKKDCELAEDKIYVSMSTLEEMNAEIIKKIREKTRLTNTELALKLGISRPTLLKVLNQMH